MAKISVDNGCSFVSCNDMAGLSGILEEYFLDDIAQYMCDDIREEVHAEFAPCSDVEFLHEYLCRATEDLIIG